MRNLKTITLSLIVGITLAGGVTFAAAVWQGTEGITDGSIISASQIKSNFDYLKETAVSKEYVDSKIQPACSVAEESSTDCQVSYSCNCGKYGCSTCYRAGIQYRTSISCGSSPITYGAWSSCQ